MTAVQKSKRRKRATRAENARLKKRDFFILNTLIEVLDGLESASLLNGLSADEVAQWLERRVVDGMAVRLLRSPA